MTPSSSRYGALGAVAGFMFRRIAGIDPVEPGFARFRFDPVHDQRMAKAGGKYDSQAGTIATHCEQRPDATFPLDISVSANNRCALHLPVGSIDTVREGGVVIARNRSYKRIEDGERVALDLRAGCYQSVVSKPVYV